MGSDQGHLDPMNHRHPKRNLPTNPFSDRNSGSLPSRNVNYTDRRYRAASPRRPQGISHGYSGRSWLPLFIVLVLIGFGVFYNAMQPPTVSGVYLVQDLHASTSNSKSVDFSGPSSTSSVAGKSSNESKNSPSSSSGSNREQTNASRNTGSRDNKLRGETNLSKNSHDKNEKQEEEESTDEDKKDHERNQKVVNEDKDEEEGEENDQHEDEKKEVEDDDDDEDEENGKESGDEDKSQKNSKQEDDDDDDDDEKIKKDDSDSEQKEDGDDEDDSGKPQTSKNDLKQDDDDDEQQQRNEGADKVDSSANTSVPEVLKGDDNAKTDDDNAKKDDEEAEISKGKEEEGKGSSKNGLGENASSTLHRAEDTLHKNDQDNGGDKKGLDQETQTAADATPEMKGQDDSGATSSTNGGNKVSKKVELQQPPSAFKSHSVSNEDGQDKANGEIDNLKQKDQAASNSEQEKAKNGREAWDSAKESDSKFDAKPNDKVVVPEDSTLEQKDGRGGDAGKEKDNKTEGEQPAGLGQDKPSGKSLGEGKTDVSIEKKESSLFSSEPKTPNDESKKDIDTKSESLKEGDNKGEKSNPEKVEVSSDGKEQEGAEGKFSKKPEADGATGDTSYPLSENKDGKEADGNSKDGGDKVPVGDSNESGTGTKVFSGQLADTSEDKTTEEAVPGNATEKDNPVVSNTNNTSDTYGDIGSNHNATWSSSQEQLPTETKEIQSGSAVGEKNNSSSGTSENVLSDETVKKQNEKDSIVADANDKDKAQDPETASIDQKDGKGSVSATEGDNHVSNNNSGKVTDETGGKDSYGTNKTDAFDTNSKQADQVDSHHDLPPGMKDDEKDGASKTGNLRGADVATAQK